MKRRKKYLIKIIIENNKFTKIPKINDTIIIKYKINEKINEIIS